MRTSYYPKVSRWTRRIGLRALVLNTSILYLFPPSSASPDGIDRVLRASTTTTVEPTTVTPTAVSQQHSYGIPSSDISLSSPFEKSFKEKK